MENKTDETKDANHETITKLRGKEEIPKFSQICRACLCETTEIDQQLDTRIHLLNNSHEIKTLLEESTGVEIVDSDILPNHICDKCFKTIITWYRFRSQTQRSNEILEKYIKEQKTSLDNTSLSNTDFTIHMQGNKLNVVPIENVSQVEDFQVSILKDKPEVVGFVFHCDSCTMTFTSQLGLVKHQEEHTNPTEQKSFKCEHCPKSFAFRNGMHNHMKLAHHHCKRFKYHCDVCGKRYNSPTGYKLHKSNPCVPLNLIEQCKVRQLDVRKDELMEVAEKTIRETKISCILCKKNFKTRDDFSDHYPKHNKDRKCPICSKEFNRVKLLERHVRMHLRVPLWSCPLCSRSFYTIQAFRVHVQEHGTREWLYRCNVCQKEFFIVRDFNKHMLKHLETIANEKKALERAKDNEVAYVVEIKNRNNIEIDSECDANTSLEDDMENDQMETDIPNYEEPFQIVKVEENSEIDALSTPEENTSIKIEMNTIDSKQPIHFLETDNPGNSNSQMDADIKTDQSAEDDLTAEVSVLKEIVKLENPELENSSEEEGNADDTDDDIISTLSKSNDQICKNQSPNKQELLEKCKVNCHIAGCQTMFSDLNQIWVHFKKTHLSGYKPYKCSTCLELFKHQKSLRFHIKKHYSFKCPICLKIKITSSELKKHVLLTHSTERPYQCSKCARKFSRVGALKVHENTHSDKKEFICNICSKEFFSNNGLYLHLKSHEDIKELQCPICSRQLPSKSRLKRHIEVNTCGGRKRKK